MTMVWKRLIPVALLVAAGGCPSMTRPPTAALPGHSTNAGRIEAMLSVHAHHLWPDGDFPEEIRPIPLEDAARYLAADAEGGVNRAAWSRRRRAIGLIAAVASDRKSHERALRILGIEFKDILDDLCRQWQVCDRLKTIPGSVLAQRIADLQRVRGDMVDCASSWRDLEITVAPPDAPHAAYTVKVTVPRPVAAVAAAIDPQGWDHCSKFFCPPERTYLAQLGPNQGPLADPPILPFGSDIIPARTLYEHFTCYVPDCRNATFENLLTVHAYPLSSKRQVTYGLHTYLNGSADGWSKDDLTILTDGGQLWAEPDAVRPGWTVAYADKTLMFQRDVVTGVVNGSWAVAQAEIAGEFAEMVCCDLSKPPPPCAP